MAVLILNAGTASPISITCQKVGKLPPIVAGTKTPSFNEAERSSIRGQRRVIGAVTSYVDTATEAAIQAAIANGVQIPCSGDILGNIQTVYSVECTRSDMVVGTSLFEMGLTLYEVQPSLVLLKYSPGDTIPGETFTRSTIGTYFDAAGVLQNAAINTKRDSHYGPYDAADRTKRMTLLEDARTNHILQASDFSNASWIKSNVTVTTGVGGMRSGVTGNTLTATAPNAFVIQTPAAGSSAVRTNSIWARRRTGTGQVELYDVGGVAFQILALTTTFKRFTITSSASTAKQFQIVIRTSGDAIDVENAQVEDGAFASSEIQTTTVAVTRGADSYQTPFTVPPQEMTVYAKFVEGGSILINATRIAAIGPSSETNPTFLIYNSGGFYTGYQFSTVGVASILGVGTTIGNVVELEARVFGDGSVDTQQSVGGAPATTAAQSAAVGLSSAWSAAILWLNSSGTGSVGFIALQSFKIVAGMRSLAEMRAA